MNDQMEQVWRSKDGKVTGSKEEVEAYLKSKNPLAGMRFPYANLHYASVQQEQAILAFANLAPLIQEARDAWAYYWGNDWETRWHTDPAFQLPKNLFIAYDEALKQVPQ